MKRLLCVLFCVSLVGLAAGQQPTRPVGKVPEGVTAHRDLSYLPDNHPRHKLDVYVPTDAKEPLPLVVWIHGGGWQNGSKNNCPALPLTKQGFVAASINYRLTDAAPFPAQIEDCKAAIRYLRAHAKEYNIDPKRIGVWGASAGGHLVALLGTSGDVKELEGKEGCLDQSSRVQAVCKWFGVGDFTVMGPEVTGNPNAPVFKLFGGTLSEKKDLAKLASPVTFASKDDPPFLIMHGTADRLVPVKQSELLTEALKKEGVSVDLVIVEGAGHGAFPAPEVAKVGAFFKKVLQKP